MTRGLAVSLALSAGLHAGALSALPRGPLGLKGLGLGAPAPGPSECRVLFIPLSRDPRAAEEPPAPEGLPPLPVDPAGAEAPVEEAREEEAGRTFLPALEVPPVPPAPAAPLPLAGDLDIPLPPPPEPRRAVFPVRVEDIRWNRLVGDRIGPATRLTPELQRLDLHGSVRLMLFLTPEGRIRDLRVADPGPYPALTLAAKAQVYAGAPFPPAPAGMDPRLLRIPVNLHY